MNPLSPEEMRKRLAVVETPVSRITIDEVLHETLLLWLRAFVERDEHGDNCSGEIDPLVACDCGLESARLLIGVLDAKQRNALPETCAHCKEKRSTPGTPYCADCLREYERVFGLKGDRDG